MSDRPWLKFYTADWRSEITLRRVSREARSLWIDLLCLIHEAGGGRLHFDGHAPSEKELAAVLGDNPRTLRKLLSELEEAKVFSRDQDGFITSRRIIRDLEKAERDRRNGRTGGNPVLVSNDLVEKGVNPQDKAHMLEARGQRLDKKESTADAVPERYAFEGKTIRLNHQDFASWEQAFFGLSLRSELMALDEWAGAQKAKGKSWFDAVAGALAKKQRATAERVAVAKASMEATGSPRKRPDGRI